MKFQEKTISTRLLFELHPAQQNIYFEQLFNPDSAMFNFVWYTVASGELNPETMQQAWALLNDNLDTLRLVITEVDDGLPLQYVADVGYAPRLEVLDYSSKTDPSDAAKDWMQRRMLSPMNTRNGEYCRAAMIKLDVGFIIYTCWHHYVMDGVGVYRLHDLLHRVYQDLLTGADTGYLEDIPQYAEAAKAGRDYLESQQYRDDKDYWSAQLKNIDNPRLTPLYETDGTGLHTLSVGKSLEENLRGYCRERGINPLVVFGVITGLCFAKVLDSEQLILATTVHGRSGAKAMKVIGMHSNVVPLPCRFVASDTFDDLTRQFAAILTENRPHRRFPSSHLVRMQKSGDGRLSDIQLIYDKFANLAQHQKSPLQHGSMEIHKPSQPLLIRVMDHGGKSGLELRLGYSCRYFDRQDIERCAQWIAEKLVMMTNDQGLDANIYRLGLVTGDTVSGKHDPSQWFGRLIASCHISGCCFNENNLNLNLTPVDFVAEAIVQLSARSARGEVYHISHPEEVSFTDLVKIYNADKVDGLELVPYCDFVSRLKSCMDAGIDIPIAYRIAELWQPHEEGEAREENKESRPRERLFLDDAYTTAILQHAGLTYPAIKGGWIKRYFNNWIGPGGPQ